MAFDFPDQRLENVTSSTSRPAQSGFILAVGWFRYGAACQRSILTMGHSCKAFFMKSIVIPNPEHGRADLSSSYRSMIQA